MTQILFSETRRKAALPVLQKHENKTVHNK